MNIFITGCLGTIGRTLTDECRRRGHHVAGCDLLHAPHEMAWSFANSTHLHYARADVGDYRQLERALDWYGPVDLVYHCAAEFGRWNGEDYYEQLWRTNAIGTKHLIRLQEQLGFRLVFFSSSEVYGDWPDLMHEELTDQFSLAQMNDYAISKWAGELQVRNSALEHGTESVIVRLFNTYGPGEYYSPYRSVNCRFLYCALHDQPWTVHRGHFRTSTYVDDTVRTLANIADKFSPGATYNIGGSEYHSIEHLSDVVLEVTGADSSLVQYVDREPQTTIVKRPDCTRAIEELDHRTTCDLTTGMAKTAAWMAHVYKDSIGESVDLYGHP